MARGFFSSNPSLERGEGFTCCEELILPMTMGDNSHTDYPLY